jgi:hypothetical protein
MDQRALDHFMEEGRSTAFVDFPACRDVVALTGSRSRMDEIIIGFEGPGRAVNSLVFDLFEAGLLREGLAKETPGPATIVLKPGTLEKRAHVHLLVEVGLLVGKNIGVPLFVAWLYDKWKRNGEPPISIKIENHFYQFDAVVLTKTIEEVVAKLKGKRK